MSLLGSGSIHHAGRQLKKPAPSNAAAAGATCQKCLQKGHWTYECKNPAAYQSRPSRTEQLLNPKFRASYLDPSQLLPEDNRAAVPDKQQQKSKKRKRQQPSSSSSSSSSDDSSSSSSSSSDSSSSSSSDSSSSSSSDSASSSSSSSSSSSDSSSSDSSSSDTSSSDSSSSDSSGSEEQPPARKAARVQPAADLNAGQDRGAAPASAVPRRPDVDGRLHEADRAAGRHAHRTREADMHGRSHERDAHRASDRGRHDRPAEQRQRSRSDSHRRQRSPPSEVANGGDRWVMS